MDKQFKNMMRKVQISPNCLRTIKNNPAIYDTLVTWNKILDEITKALYSYMETKRQSFPRFYFLSDDDLLEILANSDNKDVIMLHLKTLFDNLIKLDINDFSGEISRMYSKEKESIEFVRPPKMRSPVEGWLLAVQEEMKFTISRKLKIGNGTYSEAGRKEWVLAHPGQVVATMA